MLLLAIVLLLFQGVLTNLGISDTVLGLCYSEVESCVYNNTGNSCNSVQELIINAATVQSSCLARGFTLKLTENLFRNASMDTVTIKVTLDGDKNDINDCENKGICDNLDSYLQMVLEISAKGYFCSATHLNGDEVRFSCAVPEFSSDGAYVRLYVLSNTANAICVLEEIPNAILVLVQDSEYEPELFREELDCCESFRDFTTCHVICGRGYGTGLTDFCEPVRNVTCGGCNLGDASGANSCFHQLCVDEDECSDTRFGTDCDVNPTECEEICKLPASNFSTECQEEFKEFCDVCQPELQFDGCPTGPDDVWNITWCNTERGQNDTQRCPGGVNTLGMAMRKCGDNGVWSDPPDVLECRSLEFVAIENQTEELLLQLEFNNSSEEMIAASTLALINQLIYATEPKEQASLQPLDLNTTNFVVSTLLYISEAFNITVDETIIDIFDNVLEETNSIGWEQLQTVDAGSQILLDNAERYGLLLANGINETDEPRVVSRPNIVVRAKQYQMGENTSLEFPQAGDLINFTRHDSETPPARVTIPREFLQESLDEEIEASTVPVVAVLFRNLQEYLPISNQDLQNKACGASEVISIQVGNERGAPTLSDALQENPIFFVFNFDKVDNALAHRCVYWNFSLPIGSGSWVSLGVATTNISIEGNTTTVHCESTHLTSFAVLVDVAGGQQGISEDEEMALQIVSYIGCTISVICLTITVGFFLMQGKSLFVKVYQFIHLNLAIALLLGYLLFLGAIETVTGSRGVCVFVAALLHYLFLSAFCWMLCEGIMLYLMLVVVFSALSKKWWLFLLIGWVTPIPFVVIGVGARHDYYGVEIDGKLEFCWLSPEKGTIWVFVAPMLSIILINVVFLVLSMRVLWKNKKGRDQESKLNMTDLTKTILRATVILLPLLGLTWVFGILTLDANATVFAWLFTIFNSLQGVGILFFHVIRSDKVWSKIGPVLTKLCQRTPRSSTGKYQVSTPVVSTSPAAVKGKSQHNRNDSSGIEMDTLRSDAKSNEAMMSSIGSSPASLEEGTCPVSPVAHKDAMFAEEEVKSHPDP